jgi:hypothetical protein
MTRVTFATEGGVGLQGHRDASTNDRLVATLVIAFHGFHLRLRSYRLFPSMASRIQA